MKYFKQILLLSITLLIVAPAFSQTAQDWQNVLGLASAKIEANKRRIEAAKKAEEEAEKKAKQEAETASLQQKSKENTRYVKSMDSYFVKMPKNMDSYFVKMPEKNYEVMTTEVTQKLWKSVMNENPSNVKGEKRPVETVRFVDCLIFCNKLSEKEGLTPCYSYGGKTDLSEMKSDLDTIKKKIDKVKGKTYRDYKKRKEKLESFFEKNFNPKMICNFNADGYRLPTVDEWTYAAKGGQNLKYSGSDDIDEVAWYNKNSNSPQDVATKKANGYGLYDMTGNVCEWCVKDKYSKSYWYVQGGSYRHDESKCEIYSGYWYRRYPLFSEGYWRYPFEGDDNLGLRLVRTVE